MLVTAALAANVTIVQSVFHGFSPQGVTGLVIIEESHFSIHTWPEYGYTSVDFYTCGDGMPEKALTVIKAGLHANRTGSVFVGRGQALNNLAMSIRYHRKCLVE